MPVYKLYLLTLLFCAGCASAPNIFELSPKEKANQIDLKQNYEFATFKPPVITFIPGPMSHISSSLIRKIRKRGNA